MTVSLYVLGLLLFNFLFFYLLYIILPLFWCTWMWLWGCSLWKCKWAACSCILLVAPTWLLPIIIFTAEDIIAQMRVFFFHLCCTLPSGGLFYTEHFSHSPRSLFTCSLRELGTLWLLCLLAFQIMMM